MPELIDNGRHEYYAREDMEYTHVCENCEEEFETFRPIPPEEVRCCGECYLYAADVVQRWWRKKLEYKRTHCADCLIKRPYFVYHRGSDPLCYLCYKYYYD